MKEGIMKEALLAVIALAGIMLYVEIRMRHFTINKQQYELAGVMQYHDKDAGQDLIIPVYQRKNK